MKVLRLRTDWQKPESRALTNGYGGCGYYRTIKPAEQLKHHKVTVWGNELSKQKGTAYEIWGRLTDEYDVFWVSYFDNMDVGSLMMGLAREKGKKVIIDIDDDVVDCSPHSPAWADYQYGSRKRYELLTNLSFADALTVSTEVLKDTYGYHFKKSQGLDKKIYVIPNFFDPKDWNHIPTAPPDKKNLIIGYTGGVSHKDDLRLVLPAINRILLKYEDVEFRVLGVLAKKDLDVFEGMSKKAIERLGIVGATENFPEYPAWLSKQGWDIGIAPLTDTKFNRGKSPIKWFEYSAFEIPTIASRVYPYFYSIGKRQTIIDGVSGLLCKPADWENAIEFLIENPDERKRLGQNAKKQVIKQWDYKDSKIEETFDRIMAEIR